MGIFDWLSGKKLFGTKEAEYVDREILVERVKRVNPEIGKFLENYFRRGLDALGQWELADKLVRKNTIESEKHLTGAKIAMGAMSLDLKRIIALARKTGNTKITSNLSVLQGELDGIIRELVELLTSKITVTTKSSEAIKLIRGIKAKEMDYLVPAFA